MSSLDFEELYLAFKEMPKGTLWAIGTMEEGPFARLIIPNAKSSAAWDYVESVGEAHTVSQAIRKALVKNG